MSSRIFIGVAWPYVNGDPHLGHLAGAFLPADIFARYHRLRGNDVLLVSGSDTHGTPITVAAEQNGISPEEQFLTYHRRFVASLQQLGISFDLYTHTHTPTHQRVAQDLFEALNVNGYIFAAKQKLYYSTLHTRFLPDRYVEGICPHCHAEGARGDQCDECGIVFDESELIQPRTVQTGELLEVRETDALFLNLPALQQQLANYVEAHDHWRPHVANFTKTLLNQGLKPRPISRNISWGIPIPLEGWETQTLYIWFENVIGYLSASIAWAQQQNEPDAWRRYWYQADCRSYYFLGKDNVPFHTLNWPAELLGAQRLYSNDPADRLNLPYDVPANQFLTIEHRQQSKSRGWAVWLPDILERYEPDLIRYVIAAIQPESRDADFSWQTFVERTNNELVATWGNLVHRLLTFTWKHWDGHIPTPGETTPDDDALLHTIAAGSEAVAMHFEAVQLRAALSEAFRLARQVNIYLDKTAWYSVIKSDPQRAATTVYTALCAVSSINLLLAPFIPHAAEKVRRLLGYETPYFGRLAVELISDEGESHEALRYYHNKEQQTGWAIDQLTPGQAIGKPIPLFRKLDPELIEKERSRLQPALTH